MRSERALSRRSASRAGLGSPTAERHSSVNAAGGLTGWTLSSLVELIHISSITWISRRREAWIGSPHSAKVLTDPEDRCYVRRIASLSSELRNGCVVGTPVTAA